MNTVLSENQALHLHPDLVHEIKTSETEKVIYAGFFKKNYDLMEKSNIQENCIIRRTVVLETETETFIEIKYAGGENREFKYNWDNRLTINDYKFSNKP